MNKIYKANKNHPFLKEGIKVIIAPEAGYCVMSKNAIHKIHGDDNPYNKPEWYDEVVEEPTVSEDEETQATVDRLHRLANHLAKINQSQTIYNKETTISADEVHKIMCDISYEESTSGYLVVCPKKLATYLAKHISK
jgi:hypothetical protein